MKPFFWIWVLGFTSCSVFGQTEYYRPVAGTLNVNPMWMPAAHLNGVKNTHFQFPQGEVRLNLPLVQRRQEHNTTAIPSYFRLSLQTGILGAYWNWSLLTRPHYALQPYLGLTTGYYRGNRNLFAASATCFVSEDQYTLKSPKPRARGYVFYRRLPAPKSTFSYMAGMGYAYLTGRGRFFPILGVKGSTSSRKVLYSIVFPYHLQLSYRVTPEFTTMAFVRPQGYISRFANQDNLVGIPSISIFRNRALQAGTAIQYRWGSQVKTGLEFGGLFARNIGLSENVQKLQKPNFFFQSQPSITYFIRIVGTFYLHDNRRSNDDEQWEIQD